MGTAQATPRTTARSRSFILPLVRLVLLIGHDWSQLGVKGYYDASLLWSVWIFFLGGGGGGGSPLLGVSRR